MMLMLGLFGAACGLAGLGVWLAAYGRSQRARQRHELVMTRLYAELAASARRDYPPAA